VIGKPIKPYSERKILEPHLWHSHSLAHVQASAGAHIMGHCSCSFQRTVRGAQSFSRILIFKCRRQCTMSLFTFSTHKCSCTTSASLPRANVWVIIKSSILIACVQPSSRTLPWLPPFWASCIAAFTAFSGYFAPACDAACECCAHSHSPEMICMAMWIFHSISPHPAAQMLNCIPEAHQACVSTCPAWVMPNSCPCSYECMAQAIIHAQNSLR